MNRSISLGRDPIDCAPTRIGDGVYIGPNSVIQMGVTVGDRAIIGANSLVNRDVPVGAKAFGCPARVQQSTKYCEAARQRLPLCKSKIKSNWISIFKLYFRGLDLRF